MIRVVGILELPMKLLRLLSEICFILFSRPPKYNCLSKMPHTFTSFPFPETVKHSQRITLPLPCLIVGGVFLGW